MELQASIRVPGSCGELVQGSIGDYNLLISCPINLYSQVSVSLDSVNSGVTVNKHAPKTLKAVEMILDYYGKADLGARIVIDSQLMIGKGMASSTADITAAIAAAMLALGHKIDTDIIKKIALEIEPTDSVFLPGLHIFDHRLGKIQRYLGKAPVMDILIFSEEGFVDSVDFNNNSKLKPLNQSKRKSVEKAVELISRGIRDNNPLLIGEAATLSSKAHQNILYKKSLDRVLNLIGGSKKIYGVNIAHSGTLLGILIDRSFSADRFIKRVLMEVPCLDFIGRTGMISGGLEIREECD